MNKKEKISSLCILIGFIIFVFLLVNNSFFNNFAFKVSDFLRGSNDYCSSENLDNCKTEELQASLLNLVDDLKGGRIFIVESGDFLSEINEESFLDLNQIKDEKTVPEIKEVDISSIEASSAKVILKNFDGGGEDCKISLEYDGNVLSFSDKIGDDEIIVFDLSSLEEETKYSFLITVSNSEGKDVYRGTFTTKAPEVRIENINVEAGTKVVQISFDLSSNTNADIIFEYGTSLEYGTISTLKDKPSGNYHFNLSKLSPGTEYFFKIRAKTDDKNVEEERSFETLSY